MEQVGSAYAAALVEAAQAKGSLDAVHADVDTLQVRIGEQVLPTTEESLTAAAGPGVNAYGTVFSSFALSHCFSLGALGV